MTLIRNDNLEIRKPAPTRDTDFVGGSNKYTTKEDIPINQRHHYQRVIDGTGKEWELADANDLSVWTIVATGSDGDFKSDGTVPMTGNLNMGGKDIIEVASIQKGTNINAARIIVEDTGITILSGGGTGKSIAVLNGNIPVLVGVTLAELDAAADNVLIDKGWVLSKVTGKDVTWVELVAVAGKKAGDRFNLTDTSMAGGIILSSPNTFLYEDGNGITQKIIIK